MSSPYLEKSLTLPQALHGILCEIDKGAFLKISSVYTVTQYLTFYSIDTEKKKIEKSERKNTHCSVKDSADL